METTIKLIQLYKRLYLGAISRFYSFNRKEKYAEILVAHRRAKQLAERVGRKLSNGTVSLHGAQVKLKRLLFTMFQFFIDSFVCLTITLPYKLMCMLLCLRGY